MRQTAYLVAPDGRIEPFGDEKIAACHLFLELSRGRCQVSSELVGALRVAARTHVPKLTPTLTKAL